MMETIISIKNLAVNFPDKQVFNDINLEINRGDFLCVVGDNGAGKTTFLRTLLKQLKPNQGKIVNHAQTMGYVPQFRNIDSEYPLSLRNFVALGLTTSMRPWLSRLEKHKLTNILAETELTSLANIRLGTASGGEKQKAYLAQALVNQPELLILDESTANLDNVMKYELLDLVAHYRQVHELTVIFVTHDLPLAKQYGTHYLLIQNGRGVTGAMANLDTTQLMASGENQIACGEEHLNV
ncbi:ATP-binding cassette domain-containing protein [Periweissella beninensis]|uniref:ATP-binding cassette domain-containing protein n=1 Tax=Periweissella beninensis TaxID=504936 RepID=A0ABT0VJ00_9LACO|nr:ATP-binding cassette domain-containing protein [Periweissella beninensis]MCM2437641.1 ATP-binding cassette domain-containing protein [Periweissella beninensis]